MASVFGATWLCGACLAENSGAEIVLIVEVLRLLGSGEVNRRPLESPVAVRALFVS